MTVVVSYVEMKSVLPSAASVLVMMNASTVKQTVGYGVTIGASMTKGGGVSLELAKS